MRERVDEEESVAWMADPFPDVSVMSLKVHDVMYTSHPLSTLMRGEDRVSVDILSLPVKEMEVSSRVPPDALVMKYPEETVTLMVVSVTVPFTSFVTVSPFPSSVIFAPS